MNRIVLITNRAIRGNGTRKGQTLLKNVLKKANEPLRIAEVNPRSTKKHWQLGLVAEEKNSQFLKELAQESNGNGWLVFVHGNNQTSAKNLAKCFKLAELYNVNVLAFSWPSVHYGKIKSWLQFLPTSGVTPVGYVGKLLLGKIKQYKKAQKVARQSTHDFAASLQFIKENFIPNLSEDESVPNIVFHSMGNYLLKETTDTTKYDMAGLLEGFNRIVLHQADCKNQNHQQWLKLLAHNNVHITCNRKDKALMLSDYVNHLKGRNSRLGNVVNENNLTESINYQDWTSAHRKSASRGHALFLTKAARSPELHGYFEQLFS